MGDQQMRSSLEDLEGFTFAEVPWTTPKPLADSRVAIVTTAGLRPAGGDGADWNPGDQAMQLPRHHVRAGDPVAPKDGDHGANDAADAEDELPVLKRKGAAE